jgi:hypothetical protein
MLARRLGVLLLTDLRTDIPNQVIRVDALQHQARRGQRPPLGDRLSRRHSERDRDIRIDLGVDAPPILGPPLRDEGPHTLHERKSLDLLAGCR